MLNQDRPPIVSEFVISGLYGYRTISLQASGPSTILIARNGSGKTTLLSALDALLRSQFGRLKGINFEEIQITFGETGETYVIFQDDINRITALPESSEFQKFANSIDVSVDKLQAFVERNAGGLEAPEYDLYDNPIYAKLMENSNYSRREAQSEFEKIVKSYYSSSPRLQEFREAIIRHLNGTEIVYLPTYRRIEPPLRSKVSEPRRARNRTKPSIQLDDSGLYSGDIEFGLEDISSRLAELNQQILMDSSFSYRQISANILNELLDNPNLIDTKQKGEVPTIEELDLFFARLREGGRRVGPFSDVKVPDLRRIYSTEGAKEDNPFLIYFLGKLNTAIKATRDIEVKVEQFVEKCNEYLASDGIGEEAMQEFQVGSVHWAPDTKSLCLNRQDLQVHVESKIGNRQIPLNALSSGEKQMISLMAKMYLYDKEKLVLIDEPELSLSIDWQRRILPDISGAPLCRQLIAITHSPFVFENDLEPFARALKSYATYQDL